MAAAIAFAALVPLVPSVLLMFSEQQALYAIFVVLTVPVVVAEAVRSYPMTVASRRAVRVTRSATECVTLMVMCLRHEPSLSKAMVFASRRDSEFATELRGAIWSVMTGTYSTFDDALTALAARWSDRDPELKSSVQAMVTASREATEAGKRRALDRANSAIVAGARRRIEEYALSLSVPSMLLFGVGIILPLMVGSFLPLLSWDIWVGDAAASDGASAVVSRPTGHVVLLMNAIFPAMALLVTLDALSRHPLVASAEARDDTRWTSSMLAYAFATGAIAAAAFSASSMLLHGSVSHLAQLLSLSVPTAGFLTAYGLKASSSRQPGDDDSVSDMLFATGAAMVEGDNFELASAKAGGARSVEGPSAVSAPLGALQVVRDAATKDETHAGILAMDLSGYLKEVSELQTTMRRRLRPTVSMMRITAHVLAPIVLGITHAIYLSLASIGGAGVIASGQFFLILGLFLVEINAVVAYFVYGIGERRMPGEFARSAGVCILVSSLVYSATVAVAS